MGRISEAGSFIKNSADRFRALLTIITQVLACSTEGANNSSRSSNNIQPLVEDHVVVPVHSLATGGFSLGTTARTTTSPGHESTSIDMESRESARTSEDERHFLRKVLLAFASAVMGLAFGVPFTLLSIDPGRRKSGLTTQLLVSSIANVLAIMFCCMVMMCLLLYWGVRYLRTAGCVCIIAGFLVFLLQMSGILLVLHAVCT